ncbi:hypothetical protein NDU88_005144 [Pleurodeles waltl]|uniref:Uncharacterized protein n=1 Tax=Pleurodeles waltl TaxID=8319 RepID=A0AAV7VKS9_PLEWA|nr:hypothetical protein NDU88_005144 [Pleurodeles waltl]
MGARPSLKKLRWSRGRAPLAGTAMAGLPAALVSEAGCGWVSAAAEGGCGTGGGASGAGEALPQLVVSPRPAAGERGGVLAPGTVTCDPCRLPRVRGPAGQQGEGSVPPRAWAQDVASPRGI